MLADDATRELPPEDAATAELPVEDAPTAPLPAWAGRAAVRPPGPPPVDRDLTPTQEWELPPEERRRWLVPVLLGLLALVIAGALGVGIWLIAQALSEEDPAVPPPATTSATESESPTPSETTEPPPETSAPPPQTEEPEPPPETTEPPESPEPPDSPEPPETSAPAEPTGEPTQPSPPGDEEED